MDKRFLRAFLTPSSPTIEGYRMFPWCIKHRIWLSAIDSPFVSEDIEITVPSLIIALKACSEQPFGKPTWHDKWIAFRLTRDPERFKAACRAMIAHMDTSEVWPKFYEKKNESGSGSPGTVPWQLGIIANLVRNGVGYADAMQMPEAKAIWFSTIFSIHAGAKLDILSTDDEELIDSLPKVEPSPDTKTT
jgi:hypothetical protein